MSAAASTNTSGHETNGRFAKGNRGGPGNPFARQTAALRQALLEAVTEKDIKEIGYILLMKAQGGDLAATKLLFQYLLGKPRPMVEPDTLDLQELQQWQAESVPAETIRDFTQQIPAEGALIYLQAVAPCVTEQFLETITTTPAQTEVEPAARVEETPVAAPPPKPKRQRKHSPSTNGAYGRTAPVAEPCTHAANNSAPSANGRNGPDSFSQRLNGRKRRKTASRPR